MTSDHDMLWRRCAHLGRVLLPLVDQEPGERASRHENLLTWGIDVAVGERLIEVLAALAAHAVAADASVSAAEFDAIGTMDDDDRFDHPDFQERYELRVAQYDKERQEKAARRQRPAEPPIDLASRRKR